MSPLMRAPVENAGDFQQDPQLPRLWRSRECGAGLGFSDGDGPEERLLAHLLGESGGESGREDQQDPDLACESLIQDWPSHYHCDPARRNLLHPVAHLIHGRVLEIGAGCGALTASLAALGAEVVALEGATRRARITAARHRRRANITVLACDFARFHPLWRFDAIVVVGVLEYAPLFTAGGPDAPRAFLERLRGMLAPGGTVLLAIENQLGLSYLGGMPEDHAGRPFVGVEDRYGAQGFRTFGRHGLSCLLAQAGLPGQCWYYPFPDYKLPGLVLAEAALQDPVLDAAELIAQLGQDRRYRPEGPGFAAALAWKVAGENRMLAELADSFLVAASEAAAPRPVDGALAWLFATRRRPRFRKLARIVRREGGLVVQRRSLAPEGQMAEETPLRQVLEDEPFHAGTAYPDALRRVCATGLPDGPAIAAWAGDWVAFLRAHLDEAGTLPCDFLDCIPANLVRLAAGGLIYFDREWHAATRPALGWVVYRGLVEALSRVSEVLPPGVPGPPLLDVVAEVMVLLDLTGDIGAFRDAEAAVQHAVNGSDPARTLADLQARRFQAPSRGASASAPLVKAHRELRRAYDTLAGRHLRAMFGGGGAIGYVDEITTDGEGGRMLHGWAWNQALAEPAELVVLFVDGKPVAQAPVCLSRDDAAGAVGAGRKELGFAIPLPEACGAVTRENATVLAWSAGAAAVLHWA